MYWTFKEINEEELNIIKNLRKDIEITTIKVKNFGEGEEGKMIIVDLYLRMMTERIFHIKPYLMKKRLNILIQIIMMKKIKRRKRWLRKGRKINRIEKQKKETFLLIFILY